MASPQDEQLKVYEQLCNSYRAIDDFRARLLGFLPLATGTGVFLLITNPDNMKFIQGLFPPMGAFGFIITLGLFFYELYGIKKCTYLIRAGKALENELKIQNGQFTQRPPGVAFLINEPLAAGIIYPAVLAAWTFLALAFSQPQNTTPIQFDAFGRDWAIRVFLAGFSISFLYNLVLIKDDIKKAIDDLKVWRGSFAKVKKKHRD